MSQPKHYTANDIERYHSGQLSAAEMHALEKAALDDPFLADALEGYTITKTPASDLSLLQQKLQLRIEKDRRRRGLFYLGNQWMRVAALVILVAGIGWLAFTTFLNDKQTSQQELATNQSTKQQAQPNLPEATAGDSTVTVFTAPVSPLPEQKQMETEREASAADVKASDPVMAHNAPRRQALEQPSYKEQAPLSDSALQEKAAGIATRQAPVVADSPLAQKDIAALRKNNVEGAVSLRGDTIRNLNIVMQPAEGNLAEVVVINQKKRAERSMVQSRMKPRVDTLEPAQGWDYFDDYIANNLKQPEELKTKPRSGEVELAFDVNKNGEPVNITVVKSLCPQCDEEAVRLLREGPKWKKGKNKGKVKIRFQ